MSYWESLTEEELRAHPGVLTCTQLAEKLGCSSRFIRYQITMGNIFAIKVPGRGKKMYVDNGLYLIPWPQVDADKANKRKLAKVYEKGKRPARLGISTGSG